METPSIHTIPEYCVCDHIFFLYSFSLWDIFLENMCSSIHPYQKRYEVVSEKGGNGDLGVKQVINNLSNDWIHICVNIKGSPS